MQLVSATPNRKLVFKQEMRVRPVADAFLHVREQKLAVEGVDGGNVGEDVFDDISRKRASISLLSQAQTEHLRWTLNRDNMLER